jgi:hypothetical protein
VPLPKFANLVVERLRGVSTEDAHGNEVVDWTDPDVTEIKGCWIGRPSGLEFVQGRQTAVLELWWWGPADADVTEHDRIKDLANGITYEVNSPVFPEYRPNRGGSPKVDHKSARLEVITE